MKKLIVLTTMIIIFTVLIANNAYAKTETVEIVFDEQLNNCIFTIIWENEEQTADVEVVSPGGKKFGNLVTPNQTTVTAGGVYINVGTASVGTWKVIITGEALGNVDISAGELPGAMDIELFKVEKTENGYNASWSISNTIEDLYVDIYADTDAEGFDGTKVATFTGSDVAEGSFSVRNLDNGHYFFYVKAYDRTGVFDFKYTQTALMHENANSADKLMQVEASVVNGDIFITWEGESDEYRIMLFDVETFEMLADEITTDNSFLFAFPQGHSEVFAAAASYRRNSTGKYDLFKVSNQSLPIADVVFPQESITNKTIIFADISMDGDYMLSATLNEELLLEGSTHSGKYQIPLKEGNNTIIFIITGVDGNKRTFLKEIYLDSIPPQLALYSDINGLKTSESHIYIEGYTEAGAQLTCNGQTVEPVGSYFSTRYDLSFGRNKITISAKDIAGNESLYTAIVHRRFFTAKTIGWIVLIIIALVLVAVESVILIKGVKRRKNENNKGN